MALTITIEDGTGIEGANAYQVTEDIETYLTDRGDVTFTALAQDAQDRANVIATEFITTKYGAILRGRKETAEQGLPFPRLDAVDSDGFSIIGVPNALKKAHAEYALASLGNQLLITPEAPVDSDGDIVHRGSISKVTEKVGPLTESVEFVGGSREDFIPDIPRADGWMEGLIRASGRVIR